jgi:CPA1 family monovalent cation:H+ antiporter
MKLWHIAALLVAGLIVGVVFPYRLTEIFGQATLYVFLPALIFEAAWNLDLHLMRRAWRPIVLLAVPGVALTAGVIALCVHFIGTFAWGSALVLGAILSATDPIAVVAVFRRLSVPRRLATIVESESLLNDAVAVVLYRAIIAALLISGGAGAVSHAAVQAVFGVAIGIAIGLAIAYAAAFALRERIAAPIQAAASFAGAYGGYILADHFNWSGIFAVLTFGIALRELERHRMTVSAAQGVENIWEIAALLANVVLFFLIGAALDFRRLTHTLPAVGITLGAVFVARSLLAYGLLSLVRERLHPMWRSVVRMAGIRGALSLALALAIPAQIPQRSLIIDATMGVVIVTILVGSLTLSRRLERMDLEPVD